jgi:type VI secretion system protein ImpK
MNLLELTEPLFQFVCRLNRVARKNAPSDYEAVRAEIRGLFESMAGKSRSDHQLATQYQKVELPLIYFVDSVIADSRLHYAMEWNQNRLAYERQELAGDQHFYELLDESLAERGEEAAERLAVFYTCLGLGFVGWNTGQPEVIKRKMVELAPRIRNFVESDDSAKICPDAYKHTNTANLPLPVGTKLLGIVILFVGLVLVVAVANIILFQESSSNLYQALDSVRKNDPAAGAQR